VSQPPPYSPQHSFISDVTTGTFPGQQLDVEFNDVKKTTDAINANLKLIQRDDGAIANGSITYDQLSPALQTNGLSGAVPWATDTAYIPLRQTYGRRTCGLGDWNGSNGRSG
jgi:hypothetical protein